MFALDTIMPQAKPQQPGALQDRQAIKDQVDLAAAAFPTHLRQFRESLKLSQWSFARLIGVSETTAYRLEQGKLPTFRTYTAIMLLGFKPPEDNSRQPSVFEATLSGSTAAAADSELWQKVK